MKQTRDNTIATGGIFGCFPVAKAVLASFEGDAGVVQAARLVEANSPETELIVVLREAVDGVLSVRRHSEIYDPVVISDHVDVVDLVGRPITVHPTPGNAMGQAYPVENAEYHVTFVSPAMLFAGRELGRRYVACILTIPTGGPPSGAWFSDFPNEDASVGVVIEQSTNVDRIDLGFLHSAVTHAPSPHCVTGYYSQGDSIQRHIDV